MVASWPQKSTCIWLLACLLTLALGAKGNGSQGARRCLLRHAWDSNMHVALALCPSVHYRGGLQ